MDVGASPIFSALQDRLKFLSARASLVAENIANADTPHYKARDLDFRAALAAAQAAESPAGPPPTTTQRLLRI